MKPNTRNWLVLAALAGFLATAPTAFAQGFYGTRAGTRVDMHRDRQHLRHIQRHIYRDQRNLRIDRRQFGPRSRQARADRHRLRYDQRRFYRQVRDLHRDRRQLRYRSFR